MDEPVVLGPLAIADLAELFIWINDREQTLTNAPYRPVHEGSHRAWFDRVQDNPDTIIFAIRSRAEDALIGYCQLLNIAPLARSAELQIRIGKVEARSAGLGTVAVAALVRFGFRDLNLNRIYLHVLPDNAPALRVYKKIGFREEGVLKEAAFVDGRYVNLVVMALLRSEWQDSVNG